MKAVLGIDAAWTFREPSGVSLVVNKDGRWRVVCVAPSYGAFIRCSDGEPLDWTSRKPEGGTPDVPRLLDAAHRLSDSRVVLVALDMPVSKIPFGGRRIADGAISREFGGRWCSAHSPSAKRPGPLGAKLTSQLRDAGFPLATASSEGAGALPCTIEVYPHPALLTLLGRPKRVPYKVTKSKRYWPELDAGARIVELLKQFGSIDKALRGVLGDTGIPLPQPVTSNTWQH